MKNFIAPADQLLTADQLAAKLARLGPRQRSPRRAPRRHRHRDGARRQPPAVIREANRRLRAA